MEKAQETCPNNNSREKTPTQRPWSVTLAGIFLLIQAFQILALGAGHVAVHYLVNAGMLWEDSPVVVDGNLISSRTPADLPQFMRALIGALESR